MMRSRPSSVDRPLDRRIRVSIPRRRRGARRPPWRASRFASEIKPTGGVSTMTQSKWSAAFVMTTLHPVRRQAAHRIGSGRPAGSTVRSCRHRDDTAGRWAPRSRKPSTSRARSAAPNISCTDGRRRSASMSSTRRWYDSLSVSARFVGGQRLAVARKRARDHDRVDARLRLHRCSAAARRRYCSTDAGGSLRDR